jgi:hypothetical protein
MNEPDPKRKLPLKRLAAAENDIVREERRTKRRNDPEMETEAEADIPRYLRREQPKSHLIRNTLLASLAVLCLVFGLGFVVQPEPAPVVPKGTKVTQGLAILGAPRGYTAEIQQESKTIKSESDTDKDGFVWFKDLPMGEYMVVLSASGYKESTFPVSLRTKTGKVVNYSTDTDLKKL